MANPPLTLTPRETEYLRQRLARASESSFGIPRAPVSATPVPSFAQERLWFLTQLETDRTAYHRALNLRLRGALNADALERSLAAIVRRHAPLRTNLFLEQGQLVPVTREDFRFRMERADLAPLVQTERAARAQTIEHRAFAQPFDLEQDLMLRATLLRFSADEHLLVLTVHHIASDTWSDTIMFRELDALYRAETSASELGLPTLPIQYADYAAWQKSELRQAALERQLAYWREQLAGMADSELPRDDIPHGACDSLSPGKAGVVGVLLSQAFTTRLRELSQRAGATLFMTLLATFQLLLARHTATEDIAVGIPVANRNQPQIENLIGFFVNTLVLRGDLGGNPTFVEFLERTRRASLAAFDHQEFPFEQLVQELRPAREPQRSPFFHAFFNLASQELNPPLGDLVVERIEERVHAARFDLNLYGRDHGDTLGLKLVYRADSFRRERMIELLGQYIGLLEQIVEQPHRPLGHYSLVTSAAARVLPDPRQELDEPSYCGVLETFFENVGRKPDRIALEQGSVRWSYSELSRAARQIATCLRSAGMSRGDVVAITGERSPYLVASILGVLVGGGVILALDHNLPPVRRELMLEASKAAFVLETPPLGAPGKLQFVISPRAGRGEKITFEPASVEPIGEWQTRAPDDPIYIFFTSGSTGIPKGIVGCYKGINHFIHWQRETFGITATDRVGQLTNVSFDPILRDLFLPLTSGATLCLPLPDLSPLDELDWLAQARVSLLHIVPSRVRFWLNNHPNPPTLYLRHTFFAGEPLTGELVTRWQALCPPGSAVVNLYGPTETTLAKSYFVVPEKPHSGNQPIGFAQPATQLLVVNAESRLCGIGEPGEIVIRTPFRTLGYLNPAPADAARFTVNWWTGNPRDIVFRTGDRARYLTDGSLYLLGRMDMQVKINGVRIELHEIEAVLATHPGVKECAVNVVSGDAQESRLVAYMSLTSPAPTTAELREYLHERLLPAMVPAAFIPMDVLPRLPNGKLDRKALACRDLTTSAPEPVFHAPRTELEIALANLWRELLSVERIGIDDNFFELGGHSLLAMQLTARMTAMFGARVPLSQFFAAPTIHGISRYLNAQPVSETAMMQELILSLGSNTRSAEQLLEHLQSLDIQLALEGDQLRVRAHKGALTPELTQELRERKAELLALLGEPPSSFSDIPRQPRPGVFPLSFSQERFWFLSELEPDSPVFNLAVAYRLRGAIQPQILERSLQTLVARHEALRTRFTVRNGTPVQEIGTSPNVTLPVKDLTHLRTSERAETANQLIHIEAFRPFPLDGDLWMRALLLRLDADHHILMITLHHLAADGWSLNLFWRELALLYSAFVQDQPSPLRDLPVQYADYAAWQRQRFHGESLEQQLAYWHEQLHDLSPLELPRVSPVSHRPRPLTATSRGALYRLQLPRDLRDRLVSLSRRADATLYMTLLAAFNVLLYRYTGQTDLAVGSPIANRRRPEIEGLVGLFINNIVLRNDLSGDPSFGELLRRVRQVTLCAYDHQDVPFELVVQDLQPDRGIGHAPLFQILFTLQNVPPSNVRLPGVEVERIGLDRITSKLDLSLYVHEAPDGLSCVWEYATDLLDAATVERMAQHYQTLLESIVVAPDAPLSQLAILTPDERKQILETWNQTDAEPATPSLLELFHTQVAQRPDALAFVCQGETLTYRALDEQSNRLAHFLQRRIAPGTRVGLCLERSLEMCVGLMAILKVEGIYVPLDPGYPAERLKYILANAEIPVVLTHTRWREKSSHESPLKVTQFICLDQLSAQDLNDTSELTAALDPDHPAYIIYTSGSTGQPKGAVVPHRQILNRLQWMWGAYPFAPGEVGSQKTALNFVDSLWELFGYLLQGVPTVIIPDEAVRDPRLLVEALAENRVTRVWLVPSLLHAMLDVYPDLSQRLPALHFWVSSGEALATTLYEQFSHAMSHAVLYNLYGISEVWDVTWFDPQMEGGWQGASVPIGRPIRNMRVYVLDAHAQPVPVNVTGELYIGGLGLADGYVNRPELTAQRFVRDPFLDKAGARMYRTGDLARWLPDGSLEFLGRTDHQVKLRGFRVELAEIEAVLDAHPAIKQSVVIARGQAAQGLSLVAYYVPRYDRRARGEDLSRYVKARLPDYMVPTTFVALDAFPLTPSGKVDRRALPPPEVQPQLQSGHSIGPRTDAEQALARIWADVLQVDRVGIHDDFFEMGGHSLLGVRLFARIEAELGVRLPLTLLFAAPTIVQLAQHLARGEPTTSDKVLVPIQSEGTRTPFFCVHGFGGGVIDYQYLAARLGKERPFYGLQAAGLQNEHEPDSRIEAMAARYNRVIRSVQLEGPYLLGGYCFGGVVAFEMARQLRAEGEFVGLVAIIEGSAPQRLHTRISFFHPRRWLTIWKSVPYWWQDYLGMSRQQLTGTAALRVRMWQKQFARSLGRPVEVQVQDIVLDDLHGLPARHRRILELHLASLQQYRPGEYEGQVTLFRAREQTLNRVLFGSLDPELGWGKLARGGVRVQLVDGGHRNVHLPPYANSLASELNRALDDAERRTTAQR